MKPKDVLICSLPKEISELDALLLLNLWFHWRWSYWEKSEGIMEEWRNYVIGEKEEFELGRGEFASTTKK